MCGVCVVGSLCGWVGVWVVGCMCGAREGRGGRERERWISRNDLSTVCNILNKRQWPQNETIRGVRDRFNSIQELLKDTLDHLKQKRRRFECLKDCFNEDDELKV